MLGISKDEEGWSCCWRMMPIATSYIPQKTRHGWLVVESEMSCRRCAANATRLTGCALAGGGLGMNS